MLITFKLFTWFKFASCVVTHNQFINLKPLNLKDEECMRSDFR